jgi:hypothetical protein
MIRQSVPSRSTRLGNGASAVNVAPNVWNVNVLGLSGSMAKYIA